jgi:amidase
MTARPLPPFVVILLLMACAEAPTSTIQAPAAATASIDVVELSAADAAARFAAGTLTARALTEAYLARIAAVDKSGPALQSIIELNPQAVADASRLDTERAAGTVRGPLHGLPVLLKDNIDVVGMVNSAGSLALADHRPAADAFLVTRLREAGAVILGKTNLSEWANFRSTRSSSGWSSRGGQTRHAYVLDRNPCGSSAGTGTAMTASLAALWIGTETDGSILCPAAVSGLVGLKPTVGVVSRNGIIPISITQDTAGPMTRTVTDAALLMTAIAVADAGDPAGAASRGKLPADFTTGLTVDALTGKRFGVLRQAMGYHPGVDAAMETAISTLKAAGAETVDVRVPTYNDWNDAEFQVLLYEFKDGLNKYLAASKAPHGSLEALIAWNTANAARAMPFFGQELFEQAQAKGPLTEAAYVKAKADANRLAGRDGLLKALDGQKLDALIAPAMSPTWPTDHVLGDHFVGAGYGMAAVAGTPSLTVPMGETSGLPLGLAFMGRAYADADLLAWGFAFEQRAKARRPPTYKPTLE